MISILCGVLGSLECIQKVTISKPNFLPCQLERCPDISNTIQNLALEDLNRGFKLLIFNCFVLDLFKMQHIVSFLLHSSHYHSLFKFKIHFRPHFSHLYFFSKVDHDCWGAGVPAIMMAAKKCFKV